jgi:hypothetical protein
LRGHDRDQSRHERAAAAGERSVSAVDVQVVLHIAHRFHYSTATAWRATPSFQQSRGTQRTVRDRPRRPAAPRRLLSLTADPRPRNPAGTPRGFGACRTSRKSRRGVTRNGLACGPPRYRFPCGMAVGFARWPGGSPCAASRSTGWSARAPPPRSRFGFDGRCRRLTCGQRHVAQTLVSASPSGRQAYMGCRNAGSMTRRSMDASSNVERSLRPYPLHPFGEGLNKKAN